MAETVGEFEFPDDDDEVPGTTAPAVVVEAPAGEGIDEQAFPQEKPPALFGPEAQARAMEEELAQRAWWEKILAGFGTALDMPALRIQQMVEGLSPQDINRVQGNRDIASNPWGMAGNLAGNVAALGPMGGRLASGATMAKAPALVRGAARVAAPAAAGAASTVATSPTLPGESELDQALMGAATGMVGQGAATALPKLVRGAAALLSGSGATRADRKAVQRLIQSLEADGYDPRQVLADADDLAASTGKPVTLGDVIGEATEANRTKALLQEGLSTAEGAERGQLIRGIEGRSQGQQDRVVRDLARRMGASEIPRSQAFEELAKVKNAAADPLYKKAFANTKPIVDEEILELWDRPSMLDALRGVIKGARERGEKMPTVAWSGDPAKVPKALLTGEEFKPGVPMIYAPTIKMLDSVKRRLYDLETEAHKISETSGLPKATESSRDITDTRRRLTKLLDENVAPSEYKQARKIWGDYAEMESAYKRGSTIWKHDPAVIAKMVKEATPAERDAFASGVFAQINEGMTSKEQLDWAGNHLLRDRKKMQQLRAAFGEGEKADQAFEQFEKALRAESAAMRSFRTYPPTGKGMHMAGMAPGEFAEKSVGMAKKTTGNETALGLLLTLMRRAYGEPMGKKEALALSKLAHTPVQRAKKLPSFARLQKKKGTKPQPGALDVGAVPLAVSPLEYFRPPREEEEEEGALP